MNLKEIPRTLIDGFRTAPEGILQTAGWLAVNAIIIKIEGIESTTDISNILIYGTPSILAVDGVLKAMNQFELRRRLEDALNRRGYDDRLVKSSLEAYCDRQTAVVACERTGHLDEYLDLIDSTNLPMEHTRIPHF